MTFFNRLSRLSASFLFNLSTLVYLSASPSFADPSKGSPLLLWEHGAPASLGFGEADNPVMYAFPAPDSIRNGSAVVIFPGGAYFGLAIDLEGFVPARYLNSLGITAFVVKYRHFPYRHPVPLMDAKRAMRLVRKNAQTYNLDSNRIGIMGFSAGGHLASTLGTHFDNGNPNDTDPVEQKKSRPDFMVLAYPVITLLGPFVSEFSRFNLIGFPLDSALCEDLSNERRVTRNTPPTFLTHGDADDGVVIQNSLLFDSACTAQGVPCNLYINKGMGHGYSITGEWPALCINWLKTQKMIPQQSQQTTQTLTRPTCQKPSGMPSIESVPNSSLFRISTSLPASVRFFSLDGKCLSTISLSANTGYYWNPPSRGMFVCKSQSNGNSWSTRISVKR